MAQRIDGSIEHAIRLTSGVAVMALVASMAKMSSQPSWPKQIHFVTGKLAAPSLKKLLPSLADEVGFQFTIETLPITVAALMTVEWIAKKINVPTGTQLVVIPGYCGGDLTPLAEQLQVEVKSGPRDLHALPEFFGAAAPTSEYGEYSIEIIAEINHAPRLELTEILRIAHRMRADRADLIDVGCQPGETWAGVGECVRALVGEGHRVSIDSMNTEEISMAVRAGAELVLSVNSGNREAARDWGCPVVIVPDDPVTLAGFDQTIEFADQHNIPFRIDPILEPIGFGFARSLNRYFETNRRYPDAECMMGIGNLTELTDCDSAGINVLLLAICEELGIRSVLTTEVINWARSSVKECDRARRLVHHAVANNVLPKRLESSLIMLRDDRLYEQGAEALAELAEQIRDNNIRLFAERGLLHAVTRSLHLQDSDPFLLFEQLLEERPNSIDPSHAFYLGFELAKAATAMQLGKQYRQDESLNWGMLTVEEESHRLRKTTAARRSADEENGQNG